jgi:hypothetical protein
MDLPETAFRLLFPCKPSELRLTTHPALTRNAVTSVRLNLRAKARLAANGGETEIKQTKE